MEQQRRRNRESNEEGGRAAAPSGASAFASGAQQVGLRDIAGETGTGDEHADSDQPGTPGPQAHVVWGALPGQSSSASTSHSTSSSSPQLFDRISHLPPSHEVIVINSNSNGSSDDAPSTGSQQIPFPNWDSTATNAQSLDGPDSDAVVTEVHPSACPRMAAAEIETVNSFPKGTRGPTASVTDTRAASAATPQALAAVSASPASRAAPLIPRASSSAAEESCFPYGELNHPFNPPVPRWVREKAAPSARPAAAAAAAASSSMQLRGPIAAAAAFPHQGSSASSPTAHPEGERLSKVSDSDEDHLEAGPQSLPTTSVRYRTAQHAEQVRQLPEGIPSVGSADHESETCRPCFFVFTRLGCMYGAACEYCHREHHRPKRERASKQQRKFCRTLVRNWIQEQSELGIHSQEEVMESFTKHLQDRQVDRLMTKCACQMMRAAFRQ
mmetsp:Transcript_92119/g.192601  ORF Transcript_92119/g.192601 Transcript_92119/m.192601 type:complete len:442 (-) Transcript_92119:47-1372(-)